MDDLEELNAVCEKLERLHQQSLNEKGAIEMQSEQEFVGYIRREPDGQYSNEIHKWGVNYGKTVFADSIEAVKQKAFEVYG